MKKLVTLLCLVPVLFIAQSREKQDTLKTKEIKTVELKSKKKEVEHLADRTIYNFENQSHLNSGSMMEGLKKIPGVIASESVDVMYQGKTLDVYMDGKPMRMSGSDLTAFLEGLPANSIEKIEIITNPGAEFPATSGNAVLNIISSRKSASYNTLTYSGNYGFSHEDKYRNKTNNSVFYSSKYKDISWKINTGQSYKESTLYNEFSDLYRINHDKTANFHFIRPSFAYNFKNAKLLLDYDLVVNTLDNSVFELHRSDIRTENKTVRNEISAGFQQFFNGSSRNKLELKTIYTDYDSRFQQSDYYLVKNNSFNKNLTFRADYTRPLEFWEKSKLSVGLRHDTEKIDIQSNIAAPLSFLRKTFSAYTELNTSLYQLDFIMGFRGENYDHQGDFSGKTVGYNRFKLFPNASIKYNLMNSIFVAVNYNKKIRLPSVTALNPNNTIFQNQNISYNGNPNLQPTLSDNYGVKISAFDYANLSYDVSHSQNDVIFLATKNGQDIQYQYQNVPDLTVHTFSAGLPLPLMLFTKGFDELMKFNFDVDKINILYFYVDYQKYKSSLIGKQKGIWSFFVSSQFILPKEINLQMTYRITGTGNYRYLLIDKPFQNSLNFTISKKFLNNNLYLSIYGNDILNTSKTVARSLPLINGVSTHQKIDSRHFGISLTYKLMSSKKSEKTIEKPVEFPILENDIEITK